MLEEAIRKKIEDLLNRATDIFNKQLHALFIGLAEGWITEAVNVIEVAIPIENNAYRRRIREIAEHESYTPAQSMMAIAESFGKLKAAGVDLYLDRQVVDTTTPAGMALLQMLGVFAELERSIIQPDSVFFGVF